MIELFTLGDLVAISESYRPMYWHKSDYHFIINIRGKSIYHFKRDLDKMWDNHDDYIYTTKYIDLYTDIFRELKE